MKTRTRGIYHASSALILKLLHQEISGPTVKAELFSLTMALLFSGVIKMHTPAGSKIYKTSTKPLSPVKNVYVEAHGIYGVLKEYFDRLGKNGWNGPVLGINMIPDNIHDSNTEYKNRAKQYGEISIENII